MPQTRYRSRTFRRVKVTTPSGENKVKYERRKPGKHTCSVIGCDRNLSGVPRGTPSEIKKINRTSRRPERPYGGNMCSECMRKEMIKRAHNKFPNE